MDEDVSESATLRTLEKHPPSSIAIRLERKQQRSRMLAGRVLHLLTLFSILSLLLIGFSFKQKQQDVKSCRMSFMYPSYKHLAGFDLEHSRFAPKYSLYLYRELTIDLADVPQGVPVLFVPGNAGSYKQIRPIAAEAAAQFQQSLKDDIDTLRFGKRNLDFFTVDFNEDFSAFHGQTMLDQAEYLNSAITYILSLYTDARKSPSDKSLPDPTSVILIGHSMGGIVARLMQIMPNYLPKSINTIITMSTPHAIPPAPFDPQIQRIYEDINSFWHQSFSSGTEDNLLRDVSLISIAGGGLDTIVSSDYASTRTLVPPSNGFTVFTSTIPDVWISADHQAILWCDQFRKVLARALLEIVDARRGVQTKAIDQRMTIFRDHFLSRLDRSQFYPTLANRQRNTIMFLPRHPSVEHSIVSNHNLRRNSQTGISEHLDLMPLADSSRGSFQLLTNVKSARHDSSSLTISICRRESSSSRIESVEELELSCIDVTQDLVTLPSEHDLQNKGNDVRLYSLQYEQGTLLGHDYLAIRTRSLQATEFVSAEYVPVSQLQEVRATVSTFDLFFGGIRLILGSPHTLSPTIRLNGLINSLIAYKLHISQSCPEYRMQSVTRQQIRAPYESKYFVGTEDIDISVHGQAPFLPPVVTGDEDLIIQHWRDPDCNSPLDITLKVDYLGSLGKLVMRYRVVLVAFPLALALLVCLLQIRSYNGTGIYISYQHGLRLLVRHLLPSTLALISALSMYLITRQKLRRTSLKEHFEPIGETRAEGLYVMHLNDMLLGLQDPFLWWVAPLFVVISVGILNVLTLFLTLVIKIVAAIVSVAKRSSNSSIEQTADWSSKRRLVTTAILLTFVSFAVPYQFAYVVACLVQLTTCIRLTRCGGSDRALNAYHFNFDLLVLMLCVLPINLPILVVWVRNISVQWFTPFSSHHNVLSIAPIILLVESLTNGKLFPPHISAFNLLMAFVLVTMSIIICLYGVMYTYLLHHSLNIMAGFVFLYQHIAHYSHSRVGSQKVKNVQ